MSICKIEDKACKKLRAALGSKFNIFSLGDIMEIGTRKLTIAGFIRDSQMNSMMSSSKRFLVNETDYESIKGQGEEGYLIEFMLEEGGRIWSIWYSLCTGRTAGKRSDYHETADLYDECTI